MKNRARAEQDHSRSHPTDDIGQDGAGQATNPEEVRDAKSLPPHTLSRLDKTDMPAAKQATQRADKNEWAKCRSVEVGHACSSLFSNPGDEEVPPDGPLSRGMENALKQRT